MTIRFHLPLNLGRQVYVDPVTYEPRVIHPILDVRSSYCSIKTEIMQWLIEYYGDTYATHPVRVGFDNEYYIDFDTEADLMWFKLRWLS